MTKQNLQYTVDQLLKHQYPVESSGAVYVWAKYQDSEAKAAPSKHIIINGRHVKAALGSIFGAPEYFRSPSLPGQRCSIRSHWSSRKP